MGSRLSRWPGALPIDSIYFFQAKEEFGSTADIVQTIQTMTANLVKVTLSFTCVNIYVISTLIQYDPS